MKRKKLLAINSCIFILLFCLLFRVCYLKICYGEAYEYQAKLQSVGATDEFIPARRGSILDRNHLILASSVPVYNVIFDPMVVSTLPKEEQEHCIHTLERILSVPSELLWEAIAVGVDGTLLQKTYYIPIAKKIPSEQAEELKKEQLKGVWLEKDEKRNYPFQSLAAHVIGFQRGDNYWGLEKSYQDLLAGQNGRRVKQYGENGAETLLFEPMNGYTLVTTLDAQIQQIAEEGVQEAKKQFPCETASILVMDPNTGEILAMACSSSFDLNTPSIPLSMTKEEFYSLPAEEQAILLNKQWNNFNISNTFEPGSIFKPLVAAAALDEGLISPETSFYCAGYKQVEDWKIHCIRRTGHKEETLEDVLANSCNVAMMDIADQMGKELFYKYQTDFGFGEKTGIDLPNEASAASLVYPLERLGPVELATSSFGQSFNCTPLQAITAFSVLANGGLLMRPYIVSQILDENGNIVIENKPEVRRKVLSKESCQTINQYLQSVIDDGTGKKAKIEGYRIAGKSGTGQQGKREEEQYTITFIGYLPADEPEVITLVVIDKPEEYADGVTTAAPAFKIVMEKIVSYLSIPPTETITEEITENIYQIGCFTGQSREDVLQTLDALNIKYTIAGSGTTITGQFPKEGTILSNDAEVLLYAE